MQSLPSTLWTIGFSVGVDSISIDNKSAVGHLYGTTSKVYIIKLTDKLEWLESLNYAVIFGTRKIKFLNYIGGHSKGLVYVLVHLP